MMGLHLSRIVIRYDADSPDANIEMHIDEKCPHISERDSTDVSADYDSLCVAHNEAKPITQLSEFVFPEMQLMCLN